MNKSEPATTPANALLRRLGRTLHRFFNDGTLRGGMVGLALFALTNIACQAATIEFNSAGGTNSTNGLHFYIEDTTKIQVRRANNTGQVYLPTATPSNNSLDNGIFIRANGAVYGPSHNVGGGFTPGGGNYSTASISAASPANPSLPGVQQSATSNFGINAGPQVAVVWRYTTPLDFLTAEVTLTIPAGYPVSANNPVRFYHVFDTFLGGSDSGCGVRFVDNNNHVVVGTYPPPNGTNCPSSSAIPNGVSIVESFRERSGRSFSNYCTALWSSFFNNGSPNCSVLQNAALSNTIITSFQDTGIGVEYDFTASGTYTFSYDFVIGSTGVPAYDHIEIQHRGSATLCPEPVQVLACTSSTVPCPPANIVNTGTINGDITATPAAPALTRTPSSFSIGGSTAGGTTDTITLQGSAPGGTYTLGAGNVIPAPLNGSRCWNGSSSSCTLTVANTPCVQGFECVDSAKGYQNGARNPLYTKLAGTSFNIDVVAIDSNGNISSGYTASKVSVELFNGSTPTAPSCPAMIMPAAIAASMPVDFVPADKGKKTVSLTLANASPSLRCKVTDSSINPAVSACSSDHFAVRPSAPIISTLPVMAMPPAPDTPEKIKAGVPFQLSASTKYGSNYQGNLLIDKSKLQVESPSPTGQTNPSPTPGVLGDLFDVNNVALTLPVNVQNSTNPTNATYSEVGYLYLLPGALVDKNFTAVDQDKEDCVKGSTEDSLVGNLYGCDIGNKTKISFGRFIPDHFTVTSSLITPVCNKGSNPFSYMNQIGMEHLVSATIQAQNASGGVTMNYTEKFANSTVSSQLANNGTSIPASRLRTPYGTWSAGIFMFTSAAFDRQTSGLPDGPYDLLDIGVELSDEMGQVQLQNLDMNASSILCGTPGQPICTAKKIGTTSVRYGRVALANAFGSEVLPLPVPLRLEYWAGANLGWQRNNNDVCTSFSASQFALNFPAGTAAKPNNLAACETIISLTGTPPNQSVRLSAPGVGNAGWTDLTLNLAGTASGNACVAAAPGAATTANLPALQFNWLGTGSQNPRARATFGVYKNADQFIYSRELH
jgi:hypothetical protein